MPQNSLVSKKSKTLNFGNLFTGNMVKPPEENNEIALLIINI